MKITQSQKRDKKFSFSGMSDQQLILIHNSLPDNSDGWKMKESIKLALYESLDEDETLEEYGYGVKEYWKNAGLAD